METYITASLKELRENVGIACEELTKACLGADPAEKGHASGGAGMTITDARENYCFFSGKLSDVVRQLNFAGIAIFWIFRAGDKNGGIPYSDFLLWPLGFMIASLAVDLLH